MRTTVLRSAALLAALLPLAACGGDSPETPTAPGTDATAQPSAAAHEHAIVCGCALEEVRHCSEWIEIDGEWVALELPTDMGPMPFCGQTGLRAAVEGEVVDDTFVATSFAYVD